MRRMPRYGLAGNQPARRGVAPILSSPGLSRNGDEALSGRPRQQGAGTLHFAVQAAGVIAATRPTVGAARENAFPGATPILRFAFRLISQTSRLEAEYVR